MLVCLSSGGTRNVSKLTSLVTACLVEHSAEGSSSEDNLTGALILSILSRIVHVTGLFSSLGVRGSCWLVSIVSESCSDTAQKSKRKKKVEYQSHLFISMLKVNHMHTYMLCVSFWQELPPTHFVPFGANNSVVKLSIYALFNQLMDQKTLQHGP